MSNFQNGTLSFQLFTVPHPERLPQDLRAAFVRAALPALDSLGEGRIHGWCGWPHVMARELREEHATLGGYLFVQLVTAQKAVPSSLFRAECKLEELAQLAATGSVHLSARSRSDIRQSVAQRLLGAAQPSFQALQLVGDLANLGPRLFGSTTSDGQTEDLAHTFHQTTGCELHQLSPENMALLRGVDHRQLEPCCFSGAVGGEQADDLLGHDFLTWLWYVSEAHSGFWSCDAFGAFGILLEGPFTFVGELGGAHEVCCKHGEPRVSTEAKSALLAGKKLARAKLVLVLGEESWACTLDAGRFTFRSLRLPGSEALDMVSRFQERMAQLEGFAVAFNYLFSQFLLARSDAARWPDVVADMRKWITARYTRN